MEITNARYRAERPVRKRRRPTKLFAGFLLGMALLLGVSGYGIVAMGRPVPAVAAEKSTLSKLAGVPPARLAWPATGQAAIGSVEDGVLAVTEGERQQPIASMTKAITALVILEKQPLSSGEDGPKYTIGQADIDNYRRYIAQYGSVMGVMPGQVLSQRQALQGMLLPSANNIADSLVVWVFGSMDAYLEYANRLLAQWGLTGTVLADASGFSAGSKSTPSDMIRIGQKLMENPVLAGIVSQKEAFIPGTGTILNTNALLYDGDTAGIKTGRTDEAGSCLLFAVKHGPDKAGTLLGVIMGQPSYSGMFTTARVLRDSALKGFGQIEVLPAGAVVGRLTTAWGQTADIVTVQSLRVFGWLGKEYAADIVFDAEQAPVLKNQIVGQATLASGGSSVQLMTDAAIERPGVLWRLFH